LSLEPAQFKNCQAEEIEVIEEVMEVLPSSFLRYKHGNVVSLVCCFTFPPNPTLWRGFNEAGKMLS
jgi:hypothetical protein